MHPILFSFGGWTTHTYGVVYLVAFLAGIIVIAALGKREGIPFGRMLDFCFQVAIAGEIGAHLTFAMVEWRRFFGGQVSLREFLVGGRVVLGGVLVGLAYAVWWLRRYRIPALPIVDASFVGAALGMGIGRLGCLSAGCCYGAPTKLWWGITFTDPMARRFVGTPLGVPLHPTQILQSLDGFLLFGFLLWLYFHRNFFGQVAAVFWVWEGISRFLVEFLRADPRGHLGLFTTSQWIGLTGALCGIVWLVLASARHRRLPAPAVPAGAAALPAGDRGEALPSQGGAEDAGNPQD